jgi:hypothetical protein
LSRSGVPGATPGASNQCGAHVNQQRPDQALNIRYPAEIYNPSSRPYNGLPELEYPFDISRAFAGQKVGVKQVSEQVWLLSIMQYDLGYFEDETCGIESAGRELVFAHPRIHCCRISVNAWSI